MASRSPSPPGTRRNSVESGPKDASGNPQPKRFQNGWSKEQDNLMAEWADIAGCYRWMHDRAEKTYTKKNMAMTIPVIILSTLTGTASVGITGITDGNEDLQKYLNFAIGGVSLIAGILTTLNNFFKYAQLSESHRSAGTAWGKFQRLIAVELAQAPMNRMDSLDFLKICRADLDRLIEQSPAIPDEVIAAFEKEYRDRPKLKRPDICHGLDHTHVYDNTQSRLKDLTAEAALTLMHKKKTIRESILPDLDRIIEAKVTVNVDKRQQELEAMLKSSQVQVPKFDSSSLFTNEEIDYKTLLEKRRKATSFLRNATGTSSRFSTETNVMIDNPMRADAVQLQIKPEDEQIRSS
jgi:hypothetical protein